MDSSSRPLFAELFNRPLGRRVDTRSGADSRGSTGHQANPWFAISRDSSQEVVGPITADEEYGEVWFGALAWSGSWRITVEQTQLDSVRLTGGFNPFDFGYKLNPGERLETPLFYGGYSDQGLGGASRFLHHF